MWLETQQVLVCIKDEKNLIFTRFVLIFRFTKLFRAHIAFSQIDPKQVRGNKLSFSQSYDWGRSLSQISEY